MGCASTGQIGCTWDSSSRGNLGTLGQIELMVDRRYGENDIVTRKREQGVEEAEMKVKGIIVGASILILLFGFSEVLLSQEMKFELNKGYGMKEILASYEGKRVAVRLDGGEELEGTLTTVGEQLVHISRLSKRDFYDAVVRMDKINAVIFRARSN